MATLKDTDVTGRFQVKNGTTSSGYLDVFEDADSGSNYVRLQGPSSMSGNPTVTLPDDSVNFQTIFTSADTMTVKSVKQKRGSYAQTQLVSSLINR